MNTVIQKGRTISLTDRESAILDVVNSQRYCSSSDVAELMPGDQELLAIMRAMHGLFERGLLERIDIDGRRLYKARSNYFMRKAYRVSSR